MRHTVDDFRKEIESIHGDVLVALFISIKYPPETRRILGQIHALLSDIETILDNEN